MSEVETLQLHAPGGDTGGGGVPTSYTQWVRWWPISLSQAHLGPQPA